MSKLEHHQLADSIRSFYGARQLQYESSSREYAQIAVKSVITMNAGVAIAYPTIAEVFIADANFSAVLWPTVLALIGVVFGILSAYSTYFNFAAAAEVARCGMERDLVLAEEHFDQKTFHSFKHKRNQDISFWKDRIEDQENFQQKMFAVGNGSGVIAFACFIASAIWFAISVSMGSN